MTPAVFGCECPVVILQLGDCVPNLCFEERPCGCRQQAQSFFLDIGHAAATALVGTTFSSGGHAHATTAQLRFEMSNAIASSSRLTIFNDSYNAERPMLVPLGASGAY